MNVRVFILSLFWATIFFLVSGSYSISKCEFSLSNDPIDVVIPCAEKDKDIVDYCIDGIKKNGKNIHRIIIISSAPFTEKAEWFDEGAFPFSKLDLAYEIFEKNIDDAKNYISNTRSRIGWIYQQFLKLYAQFVIPGISPNVLVLDADTIFLNPIEFMNEHNEPLFTPGKEYHKAYFDYAKKLLPDFKRVYDEYSGIAHHMLFQRAILQDLFNQISLKHKEEPWKAMCHCIDKNQIFQSPLSEYEIYFNFTLLKTDQGKIRPLKWTNSFDINHLSYYESNHYHYVSCHSYMRHL